MGAKKSSTGVTQYGFGKTDPTLPLGGTSNDEASSLVDVSKGVSQPAPTYPRAKQAGTKAPGAMRTKGGSI